MRWQLQNHCHHRAELYFHEFSDPAPLSQRCRSRTRSIGTYHQSTRSCCAAEPPGERNPIHLAAEWRQLPGHDSMDSVMFHVSKEKGVRNTRTSVQGAGCWFLYACCLPTSGQIHLRGPPGMLPDAGSCSGPHSVSQRLMHHGSRA